MWPNRDAAWWKSVVLSVCLFIYFCAFPIHGDIGADCGVSFPSRWFLGIAMRFRIKGGWGGVDQICICRVFCSGLTSKHETCEKGGALKYMHVWTVKDLCCCSNINDGGILAFTREERTMNRSKTNFTQLSSESTRRGKHLLQWRMMRGISHAQPSCRAPF